MIQSTEQKSEDKKEDEAGFIKLTHNNMLSRILYPNPVCLLSSEFENTKNIMTITWLTPIDNSAHFMISMNQKRFSSKLVLGSKKFTLNIPTTNLKDVVLEIGSCSGDSVNKFDKFVNIDKNSLDKSLTLIERNTNNNGNFYCFKECCAHLLCIVEKEELNICKGHNILFCKIIEGYVKEGYWQGDRIFIPQNNSELPPYMTFLGSQTFGTTNLLK
ncbi:hypothetical protein ABK040_012959 [Willaertia magna]